MTDQAAGGRLKQAIHVARARANIAYDTELALRSGVSYDTLMNWYGGKTVPRGAELRKVAHVLGVAYADLMAAYEGRDPEPPPLTDAIRELVASVEELVSRLDQALLVPSADGRALIAEYFATLDATPRARPRRRPRGSPER